MSAAAICINAVAGLTFRPDATTDEVNRYAHASATATRVRTVMACSPGAAHHLRGTTRPSSVRIPFDRHAVVHLVEAEDLLCPAVGPELVVLAHDQRLDRLGRAGLRAQPAEAAAREVEVEVVERLQLLARFAVA